MVEQSPSLLSRPDEPPRRRRPTRRQLGRWSVGAAALVVFAAVVVLLARWLLTLDSVGDFLVTYPGQTPLPENAPIGFPAWLAWQHFLNTLMIVLIIRSGWQLRSKKRPSMFWTPKWRWLGTRRISITLWFHNTLDVLWIANGLVYIVLLFATGQWVRLVPTSWSIVPNALSALLQYVSLDWPTENGWVNYNSLQVLAYFTTVFIAAPLAILSGFRMSALWPANATRLSRIYPETLARAIHFPVMLYFVLFIFVHVTLVLSTGALRNLNHMYGAQDAVNWVGFTIFAVSLLVIAAAWMAARPAILAPIAQLWGTIKR